MKTKILIILSSVILTACDKSAISSSVSDKNGMEIDLVFEHDGCKVYRFYDQGIHYYSDCSAKINKL